MLVGGMFFETFLLDNGGTGLTDFPTCFLPRCCNPVSAVKHSVSFESDEDVCGHTAGDRYTLIVGEHM